MVKTTRKSIGPFLLVTGSSGTSNLSCPLNSNTIFFPPFLNLNHMKSSYLSFLVWKQSSPWKELLSGMFLLMCIIKIIIIIKKTKFSTCCTQLAVLMATTFHSHAMEAAVLSFHPRATAFPVPVAVPVGSVEVKWGGTTASLLLERRHVRSEDSTALRRGWQLD